MNAILTKKVNQFCIRQIGWIAEVGGKETRGVLQVQSIDHPENDGVSDNSDFERFERLSDVVRVGVRRSKLEPLVETGVHHEQGGALVKFFLFQIEKDSEGCANNRSQSETEEILLQ